METEIAPESIKMVTWQRSLQRGEKKMDFGHVFFMILDQFSMDFLDVFDAGLE